MPTAVQDIVASLFELAPANLAADWDNVGLLAGDPSAPVSGVAVALDPTPAAVAAAARAGAQLLVTHHPILFSPLRRVRTDEPEGEIIAAALRAGVAICAMHTNADRVRGGLNDLLAQGLRLRDVEVLEPSPPAGLLKLAVFVPLDQADAVRQAMAAAGAGRLGDYAECSFGSLGTGTYRPLPGAQPYAGAVGELAHAEELRLEMLVPRRTLPAILSAMLAAHPYEEVAYDLYPLENSFPGAGDGRIGRLDPPRSLQALAQTAQKFLQAPALRVVGEPERTINTVAVASGSAGNLVARAAARGAEAMLLGECQHHHVLLARQLGLALLEAGHHTTERLVIPYFVTYLKGRFPDLAVIAHEVPADRFLVAGQEEGE